MHAGSYLSVRHLRMGTEARVLSTIADMWWLAISLFLLCIVEVHLA